MPDSTAIRVLVVDDHPIVRAGLRHLQDFHPADRVVAEAVDGASALTEAQRVKPDVVILDYRLPDQGGGEVCRRLNSQWPQMRVLFLSSFADTATVGAALDARSPSRRTRFCTP